MSSPDVRVEEPKGMSDKSNDLVQLVHVVICKNDPCNEVLQKVNEQATTVGNKGMQELNKEITNKHSVSIAGSKRRYCTFYMCSRIDK